MVGSARQIAFSPSDVEDAKRWWNNGSTVGEIVQRLNDLPGMPSGLFILGDPGRRIADVNLDSEISTIGHSLESPVSRLPVQRLSVRLDHALAVTSMLERRATVGIQTRGTLARQVMLLGALRRLLATADAMEQSAQSARSLAEPLSRAGLAAGALWNDVVSGEFDVTVGTSFGDVFQSALGMGSGPNPEVARPLGSRCETCSGELWENEGSVFSGRTVVTRWCVGCGVQFIGLADEANVETLNFPPDVYPGCPAVLVLGTENLTGQSTAHIQIRDKSQRAPILNEAVNFTGDTLRRSFEVPMAAGPDIGSVRALVVDGPYLTYHRRVFRIGRK